jgi:hypothetical protein
LKFGWNVSFVEGCIGRQMIRKLKTFVTSLGFFDQAIAAPSMKAALEAWGADSNLFHQGAAKQTEDPDIVAATMAAPGVVLKRPVGSTGPFSERADLPKDIDDSRRPSRAVEVSKARSLKSPSGTVDPAAERKAALAFDKEEKRREREQAKEERGPPKGTPAETACDREGATSLGPSPEEVRRRGRRHPRRNLDAGGPAARRARQVGKRAGATRGVAATSSRIAF